MGEFSNGNIQQQKIAADHEPKAPEKEQGQEEPKGVPTDVDGVYADAEKMGMPVFDVTPEEFYNNMKMDRKRLRFKNGTKVQQYYRNTRYSRPFWIRNSEDGYMRKIK